MTLRLALVTGRWRTGPIWGLAYAVAVGRAEDGMSSSPAHRSHNDKCKSIA
jgi:hypothetical protein